MSSKKIQDISVRIVGCKWQKLTLVNLSRGTYCKVTFVAHKSLENRAGEATAKATLWGQLGLECCHGHWEPSYSDRWTSSYHHVPLKTNSNHLLSVLFSLTCGQLQDCVNHVLQFMVCYFHQSIQGLFCLISLFSLFFPVSFNLSPLFCPPQWVTLVYAMYTHFQPIFHRSIYI